MKNLKSVLLELQSKTIGIAKIHGSLELVTEEDQYSFTTYHLSELGGLSENHYPKSRFQFVNFPYKFKTLSDFMNEPNQFHNWFKEYFPENK